MFPVTVTIHSPAQLAAVLGAMGGLPSLPGAQVPSTVALAQQTQAKDPNPLKETAAALSGKSTPAATGTASPAPGPRTAAAGAETAAPEKTAAAQGSSIAASAAGSPPASTAADAAIPYVRVADAITAMVKTNRQKAVDTLAKFGAKKGPDLKAEQYAEFLAALEA